MKIVFLLPGTDHRKGVLNGQNIRDKVACSGTDTSVILIAEYLAEIGHDVTIVLDKTDKKPCNNVKYTDFTYSGIASEVDVVVATLWFADESDTFLPFKQDYNGMPFKVNKTLVYWQHLPWLYGYNAILEYLNKNTQLNFQLVSPSIWSQSLISGYMEDLEEKIGSDRVSKRVIANPLVVDIFEEIEKETSNKITKKERSTIFHSQGIRGGAVASRAIEELRWEPIDFLCYLNDDGLGKKQLYRKLLMADYFVFPVYNVGNKSVLQDTFCCAVAEAMAAGVITITYPLGGVKEHFGDGCVFLPFPIEADVQKFANNSAVGDATYMDYTGNIKNVLLLLESNPILKNNIRDKAKQIARYRFDYRTIGREWNQLLEV